MSERRSCQPSTFGVVLGWLFWLASLLVFLCDLTVRIPVIISMTFPNGSLRSLTMVYVVLVSWQWKNDLISCLHFYNGILETEKCFYLLFLSVLYWYVGNGKNNLISCLHFYNGILEMVKCFYFLFLSALYWYPGNGKNDRFHVCIFILVAWKWKLIFFLYSCLCCIGILAMENELISLSAFFKHFSLLNDDDNMKFLLVRLGTTFFIF